MWRQCWGFIFYFFKILHVLCIIVNQEYWVLCDSKNPFVCIKYNDLPGPFSSRSFWHFPRKKKKLKSSKFSSSFPSVESFVRTTVILPSSKATLHFNLFPQISPQIIPVFILHFPSNSFIPKDVIPFLPKFNSKKAYNPDSTEERLLLWTFILSSYRFNYLSF